ncbi:efflux RND transporter periplasmic adaptor subunit [Pleomorphomonas sp. PLEO]|uniref:efflux RND transporter periplasmic adaptor subunit n=1 Tax=Pleomorphomonas sp. PLEO TaxID=3239306 RepID=UPI00351DC666
MRRAAFVWSLPLGLLLLAACEEKSASPESSRPVRTVAVAFVDGRQTMMQTGTVTPRLETDLGFQVSGRLLRRAVDVGARIKAGDLIAAIDPSDILNEVKTAEADVASSSAAATVAQSNLDRQRWLFDRQIVAKVSVETAESDWKGAVAKRDAATATLANARNKLGYADLRATISGVVTATGANAGQVVGAGQMVVRLASDTDKDASFDVAESVINTIPADVPVRVTLLADASASTLGKVREISPSADDATRSYRVKVALPNAPEAMNLGATVTGSIVAPGVPEVELPAASISGVDGKPAVFVVDTATGRLSLKPVTVDRYGQDNVLISKGLDAGERVVIAGVSKLRPGQIVSLEGAAQ